MEEFQQILDSDLSEVEKLAQTFGWITGRIVEHGHREVELARAMQDREMLVKAQIKLAVMEHSRQILDYCYIRVTGGRTWHDQDRV